MRAPSWVALFVALALTACNVDAPRDVERYEPDCFEQVDRERLAKLLVDCTAAGNPKSDEEGEDLVAQCEKSAKRSVCPLRRVRYRCLGEASPPNSARCWRLP